MEGIKEKIYDCIITGAGPGGLQAAIYLGRYNRSVLIIDRGGGRTRHAKHIENFLSHKLISGQEIIEKGIEQARSFNAEFQRGLVTKILKKDSFEVYCAEDGYLSKFVIVSSGVYDRLPPIENIHRFFGRGFYTCIDCDGYKATNKKLAIVGNHIKTVHLAFAMQEMFTRDISLILYTEKIPDEYREELARKNIALIAGWPIRIIGEERIEGLELKDGRTIECEAIMSHFGYKLNDEFLSGLNLKKDSEGFKYMVNSVYESSLSCLYIVGPLNQGHDQAVIAAGEGAVAAIDIKKRLLEI
ncbi:MAG: NAD(P)/FAD-dependent oxidoreductase [Nitrospirae bacterium]|nr:NAD(P)/FAD-dependent oxidoreductase [Nitrospirota bacterium]